MSKRSRDSLTPSSWPYYHLSPSYLLSFWIVLMKEITFGGTVFWHLWQFQKSIPIPASYSRHPYFSHFLSKSLSFDFGVSFACHTPVCTLNSPFSMFLHHTLLWFPGNFTFRRCLIAVLLVSSLCFQLICDSSLQPSFAHYLRLWITHCINCPQKRRN